MAFYGRHIFAILEKPLDWTTKLVLDLAKGDSSGAGGGKDGHYKPSPSTHSPITSNPLVPAFLLVLVGFLVLYSSPVQTWLQETDDLPTLAQIFSFSRKQKPQALPKQDETVSVWAAAQSGFYYCQGGTLFGNGNGAVMAQGDALTSGYRPFGGEYCSGGQHTASASSDPQSQGQPQSGQAGASTPVEASLGQGLAKPSEISNAAAGIKVWAIKEIGSYYCRGQVLFGNSRGKLMTQTEALSAGYRPSVSPCISDPSNEMLAGNPPVGRQQPSSAKLSGREGEPLALLSSKSEQPKADGSVHVWVKRQFGFYYCRNDVLFGSQPGQLMTQESALTAGYHPSDGHCTDGSRPRATAERLPPRGFPRTR